MRNDDRHVIMLVLYGIGALLCCIAAFFGPMTQTKTQFRNTVRRTTFDVVLSTVRTPSTRVSSITGTVHIFTVDTSSCTVGSYILYIHHVKTSVGSVHLNGILRSTESH
jgi:hypothetical protein